MLGRGFTAEERMMAMTEQEWLECSDPQKMLEFLRGKASDRKFWLFVAKCARQIRPFFQANQELSNSQEDTADLWERYADGQVTELDVTKPGIIQQPGRHGPATYPEKKCERTVFPLN
jgi:hypothetical protein